METIYTLNTIKNLLQKYNLAPLKKLGQNFLCDKNILEKIALTIPLNSNVIEIGPGLGGLTRELSKRSKKVVAIEIDSGMINVLSETLSDCTNVTVINADALKTDFNKLAEKEFDKENFSICGNLPYYITGPLIMQILNMQPLPMIFTAMVQKEVAERICSSVNDNNYSGFSASVAYFGKPSILFNVGNASFYPQPDVDSSVFSFSPVAQFDIPFPIYDSTVKSLFAMRRKTVLNNMKKGLGLSSEECTMILNKCDIDPKSRAENLSPNDFFKITSLLN